MLSRRQMLAASSLAAASATIGQMNHSFAAAAGTDRQRKFTADLRWGSIGVKANQKEAIELASRFGFESVAASPGELAKLSDAESEAMVGDLESKGLVWGSSGLPVEFRQDESRFKSDLAGLPRLAKALRRAGVGRMGTWIMPCHDDLTYRANFKQHADRLRECAKVLKDQDIRLGLEYVGPQTLRNSRRFPFLHSMRETAELIDAIGVDNMGYVLDSWHWYTAGETADQIRSLSNHQIVGCDLNDAPKGLAVSAQIDNRRELPVATGVIDLKSFLEALVATGYDGPVRAEPFNQPLNQLDNDAACEKTSKALQRAFALLD